MDKVYTKIKNKWFKILSMCKVLIPAITRCIIWLIINNDIATCTKNKLEKFEKSERGIPF